MKPSPFRVVGGLGPGISIPATPLPSAAQRTAKVHRIGTPWVARSADTWRVDAASQAFLEGLRELGYVEGKNIAIEFRSSGGASLTPFRSGGSAGRVGAGGRARLNLRRLTRRDAARRPRDPDRRRHLPLAAALGKARMAALPCNFSPW
jgi:hypothetical protein